LWKASLLAYTEISVIFCVDTCLNPDKVQGGEAACTLLSLLSLPPAQPWRCPRQRWLISGSVT
jgi:hypothetical protein